MRKLTENKQGFTLIELMISTSILSVVLLAASIVTVQIGRLYYKGVVTIRTQDTSRNLMDNISRPIQFEGAAPVIPLGGAGGSYKNADLFTKNYTVVCVGVQRYTIAVNTPQDKTATDGSRKIKHAVWRDEIPSAGKCAENVPDLTLDVPVGAKGVGLFQDGMRVSKISVSQVNGLWGIDLIVAYGENETLETDGNGNLYAQCRSDYSSSQFCAVASFSSKVSKRLGGN